MDNITSHVLAASTVEEVDVAIVGAGLAGGLTALGLAASSSRRVALIEKDERAGGNHTWSFHAGDVPAEASPWVAPLVAHRWDAYDVAFPDGRRTLSGPYSTVTSERFDAILRQRLLAAGTRMLCGRGVEHVGAHEVRLVGGQVVKAATVIDARGPRSRPDATRAGYQKFVGLEVELHGSSALSRPLLMDATVAQTDGYRFMYVLPFTTSRLLFEDTSFSNAPELNRARVRDQVLAYIGARGHRVREIVREEHGVLPLPWEASQPPSVASPLGAGYGAGWFHPVTGYSFPVAVRFALAVAGARDAADLERRLGTLWREHEQQARFGRWLNRILFNAVAPAARREIFARFYRLPPATIERFYSLQMTGADRLRILCGRPPRGTSLGGVLRPTLMKEEA